MRKRISGIALLCGMFCALWVSSASAAGMTTFYKLLDVKPSVTEYTISGEYNKDGYSLPTGDNAIKFTAEMVYLSIDTLPSGYNNGTQVNWTVAVSPTSANDALKVTGTGTNTSADQGGHPVIGSSGGGCSTGGLAVLAMAVLGSFVLTRKK